MPYKDKTKQKEAQKAHYLRNKSDYVDRTIERRQRTRQVIIQHKVGKSCLECGESDIRCLDFHHIDPSTKDPQFREMVSNMWLPERVELELSKCVLLCANCHRKKHRSLDEFDLSGVSIVV